MPANLGLLAHFSKHLQRPIHNILLNFQTLIGPLALLWLLHLARQFGRDGRVWPEIVGE